MATNLGQSEQLKLIDGLELLIIDSCVDSLEGSIDSCEVKVLNSSVSRDVDQLPIIVKSAEVTGGYRHCNLNRLKKFMISLVEY